MPRVTRVKSARKHVGMCSKCGISILQGEGYIWWKFRFGGKHIRCLKPECAPKAQDLTQSEWVSRIADFEDALAEIPSDDAEAAADALESLAGEVREFGEEQASKRENMPEQLQDSDVGTMLEERAGNMESAADELDSFANDLRELDLIDVENEDALKEYVNDSDIDPNDYESAEEGAYMAAIKEEAIEKNNEEIQNIIENATGISFEG